MLIAQITDLHVGVGRDTGARDNYLRLQQVLKTLEQLRPKPDLVLATGDLSESGSIDSYRLLKRLFDATPLEIWPCLGNHDRRYPFRKVFSDKLFDGDHVRYAIDAGDLRIIVLDTLSEGVHGGSFTSAQADWLDQLLARAPDRPTLIAQHHPPVYTGIDWLTAYPDEPWVKRYRAVIERHQQVKKILTGHVHRQLERPFAGASLVVTGATSAQVGLDLSRLDPDKADHRPLIVDEPPAFSLHFWDGEEVVTHRGVAGAYKTILDYGPAMQSKMADVFRVRR